VGETIIVKCVQQIGTTVKAPDLHGIYHEYEKAPNETYKGENLRIIVPFVFL
jgi:hypothetical protein